MEIITWKYLISMKRNISIILSGAAFIFAFLTFCITKTNFTLPQIDTSGFLVSVLTILVTILIGWQIYNVIKIKGDITNLVNDRLRRINHKMEVERKENSNIIFALAFDLYRDSIFDNRKDFYKLRSVLLTLYYGNKISIKDDVLISRINFWYKQLLNLINDEDFIASLKSFSSEEKKAILDIINLGPNILGFLELKEILER